MDSARSQENCQKNVKVTRLTTIVNKMSKLQKSTISEDPRKIVKKLSSGGSELSNICPWKAHHCQQSVNILSECFFDNICTKYGPKRGAAAECRCPFLGSGRTPWQYFHQDIFKKVSCDDMLFLCGHFLSLPKTMPWQCPRVLRNVRSWIFCFCYNSLGTLGIRQSRNFDQTFFVEWGDL